MIFDLILNDLKLKNLILFLWLRLLANILRNISGNWVSWLGFAPSWAINLFLELKPNIYLTGIFNSEFYHFSPISVVTLFCDFVLDMKHFGLYRNLKKYLYYSKLNTDLESLLSCSCSPMVMDDRDSVWTQTCLHSLRDTLIVFCAHVGLTFSSVTWT